MRIYVAFLALFLSFVTATVEAQPEQEAGATAANPTNTQIKPQTPEEKAQQKIMEDAMRKGQEQAMTMMKMTPEQRKEALRKIMEQSFRLQMNQAGFKDEKLQDSILRFLAVQEKQREEVRKAAAKVYQSIQPQGIAVTDQQLAILLSNYLGLAEDAKEQREVDVKALDTEISYSTKPRLMAFLTLLGFIGDVANFTSDLQMSGMMGLAGIATALNPPAQ